jgi:hypothetical protein
MFEKLTSGTTGVYNATPITTTLPYSITIPATTGTYSTNTIISDTLSLTNNMNKVQNQFVAVFKVERNDKNEITSAKFIKELWIETKNGASVDFEVAKDTDISKYNSDEIAIRIIYTLTF